MNDKLEAPTEIVPVTEICECESFFCLICNPSKGSK